MELDNIKLQTTWNDAAGSINNNFLKIKQAITALEDGGGGLNEDQLADYLLANGYVTDTQLAQRLASYATTIFVENEAKKAQAAAEQYIQEEVLTDYATTEYVEEREEYLVGYTEEWVTDLEKDIKANPQYYIGLKTINGASLFGSGNLEVKTTVDWKDVQNKIVNGNEFRFLPSEYTDSVINLNYLTVDNQALTTAVGEYRFFNGTRGYASIRANAFAVFGGTSSQFLKGDGSLDSNAYLLLTGGTIESAGIPLTIKRTNNSYSVISFYGIADGTSQHFGYLGFSGVGEPIYMTSNGSERILIHSGNVGDYKAGDSDKLGGYDSKSYARCDFYHNTEEDVITANVAGMHRWASTAVNMPYGGAYGSSLVVRGARSTADTLWMLYGCYNNDRLYYRRGTINSIADNDWRTIAFTDSDITGNAATATYASTARTLVAAQGGAGVAYVSGNIFYIGDAIYPTTATHILGKDVRLRYGESATNGLILNSVGNITIGSTDKLGTNADIKLYVDGGIRFAPRTIWGQSFDGTGNVSGNINGDVIDFQVNAYDGSARYNIIDADSANEILYFGYESAPKGHSTHIAGKSVLMHYGTSKATGLILDALGNVGIGTTNPQCNLDVNGTARIQTSAIEYFTALRLKNPWYGGSGKKHTDILFESAVVYRGGIIRCTQTAIYGEFDSMNFGWSDGGDADSFKPCISILRGGRVGIGTTSPEYNLDVAGTGRFAGLASFDAGVKIGTTTLGNTNLGLSINTSFYPSSVGLSLGHSSYRWHNVFANNVHTDEVKIGDATLTWDGAALKVDKPFYSTSQVSAGAKAVEVQAVIAPLELTSKPTASTTTEYTDAEIASQFGLTSDVLANLARGIYTRVTYKSIIESLVWSYEVYYVGESKTIIFRNGTGSTYNSRNYKFERDSTTGKWKITNA